MLARRADGVVTRLEDDDCVVRREALETLRQLEPPTLAKHAGAIAARLEDEDYTIRSIAVETLGKLEPARFAQHADALVAMFNVGRYGHSTVSRDALAMLSHRLPRFVVLGIDFDSALDFDCNSALDFDFSNKVVRRRLLGRLAWYRCRLRLRVHRLALYWYALPYHPDGPGHARDVEAWDRMNGNRDQSASKTPSTRKRQKKATGAQAVGGSSSR